MTTLLRYFDLLLRAFPAEFRARRGPDMRQEFAAALAEVRAAGPVALASFLVRTSVDMIGSGLRERRHAPGSPRGSHGSPFSWLDVKLGVRMLAKHPGLTLASVFALAVGIPVGIGPGHFADGITAPLPVPDGDGIRSLRLWNPAAGRADRTTAEDFAHWRTALTSFEELGAYRESPYNVDLGDGGGTPVTGASVTPSTFTILRVPPALGRTLDARDQLEGAEPVVVVGHDLWRSRFASDSAVIGRTIRVSGASHTVVGVMPDGFLFPERQQLWLPLPEARPGTPDATSPVRVFGRLAAGVTAGRAQEELRGVALRRPPGPTPPGEMRAQVAPFAYAVLGGLEGDLRTSPELIVAQGLCWMILLIACANVGMLVFARTATRANELAVRTALGASRSRIVSQVFVECLVLAVLASGVGLAILAVLPHLVPASFAALLPYWMDFSVGGRTVARAMGLAIASSVVAGVVPAIRFTSRGVQTNIRRADAARTGTRFGGLSGVLIATDVAVAVAAIGFAASIGNLVREARSGDAAVGIAAEEYLAATLHVPQDGTAPPAPRRAATQRELVRRLAEEPEVRGVAVADALPRMEHMPRPVEVEGVPLPEGRRGWSTRVARIDVDFFESLERPILAGRGFDRSDLQGARDAVIVNTGFVTRMLGGQNALGRRIRIVPWGDGEPGPWLQIVGVVGPLGMRLVSAESDQGIYLPVAPGELEAPRLGIHLGDDPLAFVPRLRALAIEVDPTAAVYVNGLLSDQYEGDWYVMRMVGWGGVLLIGILLALATSGIYAIMSFSVSERTAEIGIRTALGAGRGRIVWSVVRRAALQLGAGVVVGMPLAGLSYGGQVDSAVAGTLGAFTAGVGVLLVVGLVACTGPTRRALRIEPNEALRGEG